MNYRIEPIITTDYTQEKFDKFMNQKRLEHRKNNPFGLPFDQDLVVMIWNEYISFESDTPSIKNKNDKHVFKGPTITTIKPRELN